MFLTCKLFRIDPSSEARSKLLEILSESHRGYTYCVQTTLDGVLKLNFYISSVSNYECGKVVQVYYEDLIRLRQIISEEATEEGEESFKLKDVYQKMAFGPFYVSLFEKEPLEDYIGILAGNTFSMKISTILSEIVNSKLNRRFSPLHSVKILIEKKQDEIRGISDFHDVVEILVDRIADQYITWAWMKGTMLHHSEEFQKFVESPLRGILRLLAIRFRDRVYYLYGDGRIFTKEANLSSDARRYIELEYFYEIAKRLKEIGALI